MVSLGGIYWRTDDLRDQFAGIGEGCQISNRATVYGAGKITLGKHVRIDDFVQIVAAEPVTIGDYVHLAPSCTVQGTGGLDIGDFTIFSTGCRIITNSDDYSGEWMAGPSLPAHVSPSTKVHGRIGRHCTFGANTVVYLIGTGAVPDGVATGAGAVLTKPCEPFTIYGGVPAKPLKQRSRRMLELEHGLAAPD